MSRDAKSPRLNRRQFVHASAASALAAAGGVTLLSSCGTETTAVDHPLFAKNSGGGKGGGGGPPPGRNPLNLPSSVSPSNLTLDVGQTSVDVGGGQMSSVWAYNDEFPAPTIVADRGDPAHIFLNNFLADETVTHWHGMIVDHHNDGHPVDAIANGGTKEYSFTVNQRAALNWYHPHPHGKTGEQVNMGLAGAFIIRDSDEPTSLPEGLPFEVPLIIRDALFDKQGDLQFRTKRSGFEGDTPLVNGTVNPTLSVAPAVYRFRVLNGANARIFNLALVNLTDAADMPVFHLIGNDGGLLPDVADISEIDTSPAERLDVLVDFRNRQGATIMLRDLRSGWDLLEFVVSDGTNGTDIVSALPSPLSTITPLVWDPQTGTTREFQFEGMSRINGAEFDMTRIDEVVPFGVTEKWVFSTKGNAPHPVHVHASPFQIVQRTGGRGDVFPWEAGWKDTVLLEDGETVEVLVRFDDPVLVSLSPPEKNIYLMHCHKLSHEDAGMMMNFEIVP